MAKELELKYGCNPNQKPARIFMQEGELPIEVLNGRPDISISGCPEWMAVSKRTERSYRPAGCNIIQACQPCRSSYRSGAG